MLGGNEATYEFEGRRVWYRREGNGHPIVFLPNATLASKLWEHQIDHFRHTHDVIAVDLPGFGRSDRLKRPTLGLCVSWLERFVDDLDLAPVTLVGNCLGSLTSIHYAAGHPERVSALVLIHTLTSETNRAGLGRLAEIPRMRILNHPARWYLEHMPQRRLQKFIYVRGQFGRVKRSANTEYLRHVHRTFGERSTRRAFFDLGRDIESWVLPEWTAIPGRPPLCWIWGDANRLLPIEAAGGQVEILQPDEVHVLNDVGYVAAWEAPDEVNRIIERFLGHDATEHKAPAATSAPRAL